MMNYAPLVLLDSGEDFLAISSRLPFTACQMISCVNVTILDDDSVGPLAEEFSVSLETVLEDSRIQVNTEE